MKQKVKQKPNELANGIIRIFVLSLIILCLKLSSASAQCPDSIISTNLSLYPLGTTKAGGVITLPPIRLGVAKTYTIPLLDIHNITSVQNIDGCSEIQVGLIVNNPTNSNLVNVTIMNHCPSNRVSAVSFTYHIENGGCIDDQDYIVPVMRDSAKIVLTLDISGSMGAIVPGGSDTRIQTLKDAVNSFIPMLEIFGQPGDSLGITYYSSLVYQPSTFAKDFIAIKPAAGDCPNTSSLCTVKQEIDPRMPMNMTAMGLGLLDAKSKLKKYKEKTPNTKRMVFLFTDGLQNYGPLVNSDGNSLTTVVDLLNNTESFRKDSIKYFTVATWAAITGTTPLILQSIATASKGKALFATPSSSLNDWFDASLFNMLWDGSPQIVYKRSRLVQNSPTYYTFNLNENATKLIFKITTSGNMDITSIFKKNGVEINPTRVINGDKFLIYTFDFPILAQSVVSSGGSWEVNLNGRSLNPIDITAIADDHLFRYNFQLSKSVYTVGDTIKFNADLSYNGKPLNSDKTTVKAVVLKPGDDIGNLLSIYQTPALDSIVDVNSGAAGKFQQLMANDTSFYNALLPSEQNVNLTSIGDGKFKGNFVNTELTGIYNVVFVVNGEVENVGKIERTSIVSSVFKFGQVVSQPPVVVDSIPSSSGTVTTPQDTTNVNGNKKDVIIKIRPKNKYGYLLGPGFTSVLKVNFKGSKDPKQKSMQEDKSGNPYVKEIRDNLDGNYYIVLSNVPKGANPSIQISIWDETIYDGKLCPIPFWLYVLIVLLLVLILLAKYFKVNNAKVYSTLMAIVVIVLIVIIILQQYGICKLIC